ncbi:unnamed protein product [Victoria cruziana]
MLGCKSSSSHLCTLPLHLHRGWSSCWRLQLTPPTLNLRIGAFLSRSSSSTAKGGALDQHPHHPHSAHHPPLEEP